jgi:hypothetical protein
MSAVQRLTLAVVLLLAGVSLAGSVEALPRFTLTAGSRCSNCHINPQGSGIRSDLGWYAMNTVGAVTWDKLGLASLHSLESNTFYDGKVVFGGDMRMQFVRRAPVADPTVPDGTIGLPGHVLIPMQFSPSIAFLPTPTITAQAQFNAFGYYGEHYTTNKFHYPGQSQWDAWLRYAPSPKLPYIRAGYLQPSVGIRHDDHSILTRSNPFSPKQPLLAPFWNEPGAEVGYEGLHILNFEASTFKPNNLLESVGGEGGRNYIGKSDLGWSARATLWPRLEEYQVNGMAGASVLGAGDFLMADGYVGVGKSYWGSVIGEFAHSSAGTRKTYTGSVIVAWPYREWFTVEGRAERGIARQADKRAQTDAYVLGVQFMPVPFVELRPEYRYMKTNEYTLAQYTVQLHLYF